MPSPKNLLLFVNPRAGRGDGAAKVQRAVSRLDHLGIATEVVQTTARGHAQELARERSLEKFGGVVVYGGDGTLREVIAGLMARSDGCRPAIGVLPGGTGNSMLMHLGSDDWEQAIERMTWGKTVALDVAQVDCDGTTTYCANLVGWCAAAQISAHAERWRWLGRSRYTLAALWQVLLAQPQRLKLNIDGVEAEGDYLLALACNTRYGGRRMLLAPEACTHDGQLDVLLVGQASRLQMLQLFQTVHDGGHVRLPFVQFCNAQSLQIEQSRPAPVTLDGDLTTARSISIRVLPGALRLFA